MPESRIVAALTRDGHIELVKEPVPPVGRGTVLVQVRASLVSPGTELGGWRRLKERREEGRESTEDAAAPPRKFGYANAGVVLAAGAAAEGFAPGERVACMGGGYALHTDTAVVPQHLCAPLPEEVSFGQGAYAHLAATALHAVRRGRPEIGAYAAVAGLGIVGQLTARLHQLAGCYVAGWDTIRSRIETARKWGIDDAVQAGEEDAVERTLRFTRGRGLDTGVIAFGGRADGALRDLTACMKRSPDGHRMGRIVVVGGAEFTYPAETTNLDVIRSSRTGPGYHDQGWELGGAYPPALVRWDTRSNLELVLRFMAEGRLDVDVLTSHRVPIADADRVIGDLLADPDALLGMIFEY